MNAARRARQKANRAAAGGHTVADHVRRPDPEHEGKFLPVNCPRCRPPGKASLASAPPDTAELEADLGTT